MSKEKKNFCISGLKPELRKTIALSETNEEVHNFLAHDRDIKVVIGLTKNLSTSPNLHTDLACHPHKDVRAAVASGKRTSVETLTLLSTDDDVIVKGQVAKNPTTSILTLITLSEDKEEHVRACVASSTTMGHVLDKLSEDESVSVRIAVAENVYITPTAAQTLATDDDTSVLFSLKNTLLNRHDQDKELLRELKKYKNPKKSRVKF